MPEAEVYLPCSIGAPSEAPNRVGIVPVVIAYVAIVRVEVPSVVPIGGNQRGRPKASFSIPP